MGISEKVAYLKGLMEGLNIDEQTNEGKLFTAIVDVLDEIALEIEDLTDEVMELGDGLDVVSDDLSDVEDIVYDDDDDESFCRGSCCGCDDEADYEVTCPQCGEVVPVYEDDLSFGNIICPGCGETLEFDFDETDEPDGED